MAELLEFWEDVLAEDGLGQDLAEEGHEDDLSLEEMDGEELERVMQRRVKEQGQ